MKKRFVSIIVLLIMISSMFLACDEEVSLEMNTVDQSSVYKSTEIELPDDFRTKSENEYKLAIFFRENKMYLLGQSRSTSEPEFLVYDLDSKTFVMEKVVPYNEGADIDNIAFDTQMNQITIEYADGIRTLNKMTPSGEKIFSFAIGSDKKKILTDNDDNIYIAFADSLESYDSNGNSLNSVPFGGATYNDFGILDNGRIYVEFIDIQYRPSYRYVENNKKSLSVTLTKNADKKMYSGLEYDIYYSDSTSFYGYNESDNTMYTLLNWMDSSIAHSGILNIYLNSPERIIYDYMDRITNERKIFLAEKTDEVYTAETKDITIACLSNVYMLDAMVLNFNKTNSEYNVILNQYIVNPEDWDLSVTKLNNEILAGEVPDIIIPNYYIPIMNYINKGMFTDIYQLIDNDPDLSRDDFYDIVFSTYERDGKLYQLFAEARIYALITKEKNVNGKDTWTYDEFREFYESTPDGTIFCEKFARSNLFYIFTDTGLSDFVDYTKGTCDFDNELFVDIMKTIKSFDTETYIEQFSDEEYYEFQMNIGGLYGNDEIIVANATLYSIFDVIRYLNYFNFEDVTFMGYPSPYGDKNSTTLYGPEFMITEQSKVKEGAWEFIKYYISDDVRLAKMGNSIPTTKSGLKAIYEQCQSWYFYIDQYGIVNSNPREYSESEMEKAGLTPFELKDEYFDMIEKLMNSTNKQYSYDEALVNIIHEEMIVFFEDGKTAEETAKTIQNRASVYLSEIK